jgi:hypothetical protein
VWFEVRVGHKFAYDSEGIAVENVEGACVPIYADGRVLEIRTCGKLVYDLVEPRCIVEGDAVCINQARNGEQIVQRDVRDWVGLCPMCQFPVN